MQIIEYMYFSLRPLRPLVVSVNIIDINKISAAVP